MERYRAWMTKAEALVAKVPEFRSSLAQIEARAVPQSDEERAQERASHPRVKELDAKVAELGWMKRMLGEAPWPDEAKAEAELAQGLPAPGGGAGRVPLPTDANSLNELAWPLVDPDKPVYGSEVKGLLLARRAVAAASASERPGIRDSLAWAYFKLGRFEEALAEEKRALEEVESARHAEFQGYVAKLESAVKSWRDPQGKLRESRTKDREKLAQEIAALEVDLSMRRTWRFAEEAGGAGSGDRWWRDQLLKLVAALESFEDPKTGLMRGVSEAHGWGVAKRLDFALSVEERTVSGEEAKKLWSAAIAAIESSPMYGGLKQTPQLGLLPIGADPASGLWEFAHVQSGAPAERGVDGKLHVTEEMGLVFVLIPGGTFWMGAQKTDPNGRNYDPQALPDGSPVHEVTLSPYFLSKYEMTEGQWERSTGKNPSQYGKSNYDSTWNKAGESGSALHPVESVTWTQSMGVMLRLGLELPTEAQWENGCRAGTSSVYWCGNGVESFGSVANIADAYAKTHGGDNWSCEKDVDDGNLVHAGIGSYRANAYGLHEVHGNVWEWCRDGYRSYPVEKQVDPVTPWIGASSRVARGGGFNVAASVARSASRSISGPALQSFSLGLRPARASHLSASQLHPQVK